jgi:hypothetical protein
MALEGVAELARAADEDPAPARCHAVALVALVHEGGVGNLACLHLYTINRGVSPHFLVYQIGQKFP